MLYLLAHTRCLGCFSLCSMARSLRVARWLFPAHTHPERLPLLWPLPLHRAMFEDGHPSPRFLQTQMPKVCLARWCAYITEGAPLPFDARPLLSRRDTCSPHTSLRLFYLFKLDFTKHCTLSGVMVGVVMRMLLGEVHAHMGSSVPKLLQRLLCVSCPCFIVTRLSGQGRTGCGGRQVMKVVLQPQSASPQGHVHGGF